MIDQMKKMIFHIPIKIDRNRFSASQIRPLKMISAFKELGYEVDVVEGYGKERKLQIRKIKENILKGVVYDFLYSESSTMPTLLTESHHLPTYPFLDFSFFKFCKKHDIKIGLFYRDIYWCFQENSTSWKNKIAVFFYKYDLKKYNQLLDVLFLPSLAMTKYFPLHFSGEIISLPSGLELKNFLLSPENECVNLLYIGGIGEHYNLQLAIKCASKIKEIKFTICCRKEEWDQVGNELKAYLSDNIIIVHKSGKDIDDLYAHADLFNLFVEPLKYREFAVPYKLFETIGYGCPILASNGTWVADFVKENEIGFVCDYNEQDLLSLWADIVKERKMLIEKRAKMRTVAFNHTWQERGRMVVKCLTDKEN